jgi:hypothetical protein
MDLIVVEPLVQTEETEQSKQALSHPISIKASSAFPVSTDGALPPPPPGKVGRESGGPSHSRR